MKLASFQRGAANVHDKPKVCACHIVNDPYLRQFNVRGNFEDSVVFRFNFGESGIAFERREALVANPL